MNGRSAKLKRTAAAFAALVLAGCNGGANGVRVFDSTGGSSAKPQPQPIRSFTAAEIGTAIIGKTFQYTRADGNGFVTYNADGTFTFQDDVKGEGKGRWLVNGSQFCEAFGETAATECGDFKTTGDAYFAAKSRLVEMKT